jgi:hypothetical protein
VPSYVSTDSRLAAWRITGYSRLSAGLEPVSDMGQCPVGGELAHGVAYQAFVLA